MNKTVRSLFDLIDISFHRNNIAITKASQTGIGAFNVWRNSFAAEYLPASNSLANVGGIPFRFPVIGAGNDNIRCDGQFLPVPEAHYDWVHVLAAAERRSEDSAELHYADGTVDPEPLRISDFWAAPACFGEIKAFASPVMHYPHHVQDGVPALMWAQRIPATRRTPLSGIRWPHNVAMHIFAVTLQRAEAKHED